MREAIQIKYSCFKCGINLVILTVPARRDEDVKTWMDTISTLVSIDHDRRSPECIITKISELLISVEDKNRNLSADRIGGALK